MSCIRLIKDSKCQGQINNNKNLSCLNFEVNSYGKFAYKLCFYIANDGAIKLQLELN